MFHPRFSLVLLFALASVAWSSASEITYRKVVDTNDELPVVEGPWSGFYNPAVSGGNVAFLAYQPFTFDNGLEAPQRRFYWVEEALYDP